jgi:OmpA-OmpF porin, OOP family
VLKNDPSLFASIEGHTDNTQGKTTNNLSLSQNRAESVRAYLIAHGIDASRINAQGFGDTQPISTNETAIGRSQNRRTVVKISNVK